MKREWYGWVVDLATGIKEVGIVAANHPNATVIGSLNSGAVAAACRSFAELIVHDRKCCYAGKGLQNL